jgi:hypothetical protein
MGDRRFSGSRARDMQQYSITVKVDPFTRTSSQTRNESDDLPIYMQ